MRAEGEDEDERLEWNMSGMEWNVSEMELRCS